MLVMDLSYVCVVCTCISQLFVLALSKLLTKGSALQDMCNNLLSAAAPVGVDASLLRNEVHHMEAQLQAILAEDVHPVD